MNDISTGQVLMLAPNVYSYVQAGTRNYKRINLYKMKKKAENLNTPPKPSLDIAGVSGCFY
jgi:hypothetical protein